MVGDDRLEGWLTCVPDNAGMVSEDDDNEALPSVIETLPLKCAGE